MPVKSIAEKVLPKWNCWPQLMKIVVVTRVGACKLVPSAHRAALATPPAQDKWKATGVAGVVESMMLPSYPFCSQRFRGGVCSRGDGRLPIVPCLRARNLEAGTGEATRGERPLGQPNPGSLPTWWWDGE